PPAQGREPGVVVSVGPVEPGGQLAWLPRRCQMQVEGGVTRLRALDLVGGTEPIERIVPNGVEAAVAAVDRQHQRFRNELTDEVDNVSRWQARVGAHLLAR